MEMNSVPAQSKSRIRNLSALAMMSIALFCAILVGFSFAFIYYRDQDTSHLLLGKIELDKGGVSPVIRQVMSAADRTTIIATSITVKISSDSKPLFTRVRLEFTSDSTLPEMAIYLAELNAHNFATGVLTDTTASWQRGGNYFYLMQGDQVKRLEGTNTYTYTFANSLALIHSTTAGLFDGSVTDISAELVQVTMVVEAIQADNLGLDSYTIEKVAPIFNDTISKL